jgi:hypothetical protein
VTSAAVAQTDLRDSAEAGAALGTQILQQLGKAPPDAVILFASPQHDLPALLHAVQASCRPRALVGASSAGEFTSNAQGDGLACAVALRSEDMKLTATVGRGLSRDRGAAARELVAGFRGVGSSSYPYHAALVLTDALAGHADDLVEQLAMLTGGTYRLFGGGAGGDEAFQRRFVFLGGEVISDAAVALEMLSHKPIGIGVRHGWTPSSDPLRVTEAEGTRLGSLNAIATADVFEEHAEKTRQRFDRADAFPFFLHNIIGVDTGKGHKLRVPLSVGADGSVATATEVPEGSTVCLMNVTKEDAAHAAAESTADAMRQIAGHKPAVALFFDCVATRLRMGRDFGFELDAVQRSLGPTRFAGCNTIGQIASAEGQFSGFHNCTAVVCVIPE